VVRSTSGSASLGTPPRAVPSRALSSGPRAPRRSRSATTGRLAATRSESIRPWCARAATGPRRSSGATAGC
jgi:hypothetical protein